MKIHYFSLKFDKFELIFRWDHQKKNWLKNAETTTNWTDYVERKVFIK